MDTAIERITIGNNEGIGFFIVFFVFVVDRND